MLNYQAIQDTIKIITDTLVRTTEQNVFNEIKFDISNLINSNGFILTVIGYSVVFLALFLLFIAFKSLTHVITTQTHRKYSKATKIPTDKKELNVIGDVTAAISVALHLHISEIHDFESTIITIKKIQKTYSPWSSKIYGLRQHPKRF
ncbi:MAG: OadG family protein [Ignavibacteriales bacterium]|nr:OadG family protein [Ignavibacteriales bacterium]